MTNPTAAIGRRQLSGMKRLPVGRSVGFDWVMVALGGWLLGGLYVDGWAHHHLSTTLERFFTPWHAAFYSGFMAVAGVTARALLANRARGAPWASALPPGHGLSGVGAAIFAASGVGDLLWYLLFGIEVRMEALLSPTHIGLTLGVGLLVSGPWRAAWRRADGAEPPTWAAAGPMVLSLAWLVSTGTFWTMFAHPLSRRWAAAGNRPTALVWPWSPLPPACSPRTAGSSALMSPRCWGSTTSCCKRPCSWAWSCSRSAGGAGGSCAAA